MTSKTRTLAVVVAAAVLIVVIVVAVFGPAKWREYKQGKLLANAQYAMIRGDWAQAEKLFTELLEYLPDSAAVMARLSQVCVEQDKFEAAHQWADKAMATAPDQPQTKLQKASVFRREAAHALSQPGRGLTPEQFGRVDQLCDKAAKLLEEASKSTAANPPIQAEMGQVLVVRADAAQHRSRLFQEQADEARAAGRAADAQANQQQADEWRSKSDAQLDAAIKELGRAAKLSPKNMAMAELYAENCFRAGRWAEAIIVYRTATDRKSVV